MTTFTQEERKALYEIFPINQHEIRQGESSKSGDRIRWYIYIRKEAIITRLDDLFFGEWETGYVFRDTREDSAHIGMHLTIRGIRREFDGYNSSKSDNDDEATFKGTSTDAFKRVTALWGAGIYLKDAPHIWTENWKTNNVPDWDKKKRVEAEAWAKFAEWLRSIGSDGDAPAQPAPASAPSWAQEPARKPTTPFPSGKAQIIQQVEEYLDQHGLTMKDSLTALKLKSPEGLPPNFETARKLIDSKLLSISAEVDNLEDSEPKLELKEIPF